MVINDLKSTEKKDMRMNINYCEFIYFFRLLSIVDIDSYKVNNLQVNVSFKNGSNSRSLLNKLQGKFIPLDRLYKFLWNRIENSEYSLIGRILKEDIPLDIKTKLIFFFRFFPISHLMSEFISIKYEDSRNSNVNKAATLTAKFKDYRFYMYSLGNTAYIELTRANTNKMVASMQINKKEYQFVYNNEKNDNINGENLRYIYNDNSKNIISITKNRELVLDPPNSVNYLSLYYLNEIFE